jgi:hypothetical protein
MRVAAGPLTERGARAACGRQHAGGQHRCRARMSRTAGRDTRGRGGAAHTRGVRSRAKECARKCVAIVAGPTSDSPARVCNMENGPAPRPPAWLAADHPPAGGGRRVSPAMTAARAPRRPRPGVACDSPGPTSGAARGRRRLSWVSPLGEHGGEIARGCMLAPPVRSAAAQRPAWRPAEGVAAGDLVRTQVTPVTRRARHTAAAATSWRGLAFSPAQCGLGLWPST